MQCRLSDFRYKEVINIVSGQRLGVVTDAEIDPGDGKITALIVPGRARFFGLFGFEEDYILPWSCISRIGEDIILIDVQGEHQRGKREKKAWI